MICDGWLYRYIISIMILQSLSFLSKNFSYSILISARKDDYGHIATSSSCWAYENEITERKMSIKISISSLYTS